MEYPSPVSENDVHVTIYLWVYIVYITIVKAVVELVKYCLSSVPGCTYVHVC